MRWATLLLMRDLEPTLSSGASIVICSDLSLAWAMVAKTIGNLASVGVLWPGAKVLVSCCCCLLMLSTSSKAKLSKLALKFHALKTFLALIGWFD